MADAEDDEVIAVMNARRAEAGKVPLTAEQEEKVRENRCSHRQGSTGPGRPEETMPHAQERVAPTPTSDAPDRPPPIDVMFESSGRAGSQSPTWMPMRIAHADWGTAASKCVVATAELDDGLYHARSPRTVLGGCGLIQRMRLPDHPGQSTLLGFDFPLGVPRAYAQSAGITDFADWFRQLELDSAFFDIASDIEEVSPARPFFPALITEKSPGIKARFRVALGLSAKDGLRTCDRAHCSRPAASEMFWALGPAAVGKMTLAGWRHAIRPALAEPGRRYSIWPLTGGCQTCFRARMR